MGAAVSLSMHDWSLHRKGSIDQARHQEKIKKAIKDNLADIVSEEAIITSDGQRVVKIPIRSLDLPRFRFDYGKKEFAGQGDGNAKTGDVLGREHGGAGTGKRAGDQPGIDYYEAEITIDELATLIFEDLGLPNLQQKKSDEVVSEAVRFDDVSKKGMFSNLDRRRTIIENMKRHARGGRPVFERIKPEDLRFKTWKQDVRRESNAVVIAMRDVSASMGEFEKYISRSFYFWMVRFLRTKYSNVKIKFITHHTQAREVDEETFFKLGESGGTLVSSAYRLALDLVEREFNPAHWNIYPFHFSDGDNWAEDNADAVNLAQQLIDVSNVFGYGEIHEGHSRHSSTLMSAFNAAIQDQKFIGVIIADKAGVYPALKRFFGKEVGERRG
ncbi:MAG: sporulation protein YhbH [Chloroflexi bacterium]|nr:sporulation protein YhbH [Chloroflexota bacterium]